MEENTFLTGICPGCKKTIQVPAGLDAFSCVYCGQRLTPSALLVRTEAPSPLSEEQQKAVFDELCQAIPEAITGALGVFKYLTKKAYPKHFDAYLRQHWGVFEKIPLLCSGPQGLKAAESLACQIVDRLDRWAASSRKGLTSKESMLDEAKYTMCLLTVPAIRSLEHIGCEDFCAALHAAWLNAHPKSTFQLITYEQVIEGFRPRRLCYITTATCRQAGKPDDCAELTAFRAFRDGYLTAQPDGADLIARYYELAPGIVMAIDFCHDPDSVYPAIWSSYLAPCYDALSQGDNAACKHVYTKMVRELAAKYLS